MNEHEVLNRDRLERREPAGSVAKEQQGQGPTLAHSEADVRTDGFVEKRSEAVDEGGCVPEILSGRPGQAKKDSESVLRLQDQYFERSETSMGSLLRYEHRLDSIQFDARAL